MAFTSLLGAADLARLAQPHVHGGVVLDCRFDLQEPRAGRAAYQAGHLPGARYADLNEDLAGRVTAMSGRHPLPDARRLADFFRSVGIGPHTPQVVVYDAGNGAFAARAWWLLRWLGFERCAVLDGGLRAWTQAGGSLTAAHSGPPNADDATRFEVGNRDGVEGPGVADAAEVLAAAATPGRLVVDARAVERFSGVQETIDPVAGHVPGAVNQPFTANLAADSRFLSAAELRARWLLRLNGVAPADAIVMCGSGVTACHHLLALEHAGLPGAKLYAGSWSEWIRDPRHPVATIPPP